jgi:hypothetical protein
METVKRSSNVPRYASCTAVHRYVFLIRTTQLDAGGVSFNLNRTSNLTIKSYRRKISFL